MYAESERYIPVAELLPTETFYQYNAIVYFPILEGKPYAPDGIVTFDHIYAMNEDDAYCALSHEIDDYLSSNGIAKEESEAAGMIEVLELYTVSSYAAYNGN